GGLAPLALGAVELVEEGETLLAQLARHAVELGALVPQRLEPLLEGARVRGGRVAARLPAVALVGDRLHALCAQLGLARERVMRGTRLGELGAVLGDLRTSGAGIFLGGARIGDGLERADRLALDGEGLLEIGRKARARLDEGGQPRRALRSGALGSGEGV